MPDATAASTLWSVLLGGALVIGGGFCGPVFLDWRQRKEREKKHRAEKLQEVYEQVFEVQRWLDTLRDAKFWDKEGPTSVSPASKAYAISYIYFPEAVKSVNALHRAVQDHVQWISHAALKRHDDPNSFADDLPKSFKPVIDAITAVMIELSEIAKREFRPRRNPQWVALPWWLRDKVWPKEDKVQP